MTPIQKTIEAAFKVFLRRNTAPITNDSLSEIKQHLNKVTKSELRIDPSVLENKQDVGEAPVTYIRVLEDKLMTVAIFVLRPGRRLPMHDHPNMTGLLKVIHGNITINTYTPLDPRENPVPEDLSQHLVNKFGRKIPVYPTKFEGSKIYSESDECCQLTPDGKNIHEISADNGTAAFMDVLSPPYNSKMFSSHTTRPCSYYREIHTDSSDSNLRYLVQIGAPQEYWCDEVLYTGPELKVPPE